MRIGIPREIKGQENRVALTPDGARRLVEAGHEVLVETGAGEGSGFADGAYAAAGARSGGAAAAWDAELILKVKEPLPAEYGFLKERILFTYLHLAGVDPGLTQALLDGRTTAIAYETVEDESGRLPLLAPMSAVAGDMAPIMGAYHLARYRGGRGVLLGEVLGTPHGKVVIVGDGIVGTHAARIAAGIGARVLVFGLDPDRGRQLRTEISDRIEYRVSTPEAVAAELVDADLVIGAVLVRGARAPHVVTEAMVRTMPAGAVVVDVSIDQGGCVETSHATSHADPVFVMHDVVHYCVTNMPGAYPRTATIALTDATLPYVERLAARGLDAFRGDPGFARGLNTQGGFVTNAEIAEALGLEERLRAPSEA